MYPKIEIGTIVKYHPVIDGKDDGKLYTVRALGSTGAGYPVAWLNGKAGCVALDALSVPELPLNGDKAEHEARS